MVIALNSLLQPYSESSINATNSCNYLIVTLS